MVQYLSRIFTEFKRDERGVFSLFVVLIFTTMVLMGGAAIDIVRYETVRSSIQYNLDRAVLAAASLRQTSEPAVVVNDYMSKVDTLSNFSVAIDEANTEVNLTARRVSATATASLNTYFLGIIGISSLEVVTASQASEEVPNLEISLVLDVSGSMRGSKLSSLKSAANTFVNTVITPGADSLTSVSIVPYANNVSVPDSMWDIYTTEELSDNSHCMIFNNSNFNSAAISTSSTQRQLPHFSRYGGFQVDLNYTDCRNDEYAQIMPLSTSVNDLQDKISSLIAQGSTATHIGTKWGVALLDPAAGVIGAGIGGDVASVPEAYTEPGVLKVLVVMTDGQNTNHYELFDQYRSGASDMYTVLEEEAQCNGDPNHNWVWYFENQLNVYPWLTTYCEYVTEKIYYIYRPSNGKYYEVNNGYSQGTRSNFLAGNEAATTGQVGYRENLTWTEVWENISVRGYAKTIGISEYNIRKVHATASQADSQTLASCSAAKNNGVVVYTIAFSAPSNAEALLKSCATSPNTYYEASTTNIAAAFTSIAVSVQKLKLTQ